MSAKLFLGSTQLASESSGTITVDNATLSSDVTGTLGSGITFPAGHILQIVNSPNTARDDYAGAAYDLIAGTDQAGAGSEWCCKITPLFSTSKILVMLTLNLGGSNAGLFTIQFFRDTNTQILMGDVNSSETNQVRATYGSMHINYQIKNFSGTYIDTPSIPSTPIEIKYSPKWRTESGSYNIYLNREIQNTNNSHFCTTYSNILLMEIAG